MSAIQPSIVARLKPELIAKERQVIRYELGGIIQVSEWQPLEYNDQTLDLLPDEDAHPYQTAEIGSAFAHIVCVRTEGNQKAIRVQFHHKTEA